MSIEEAVSREAASGEMLSFLVEHGMELEEIQKMLAEGIALVEVYRAARALIAEGKPIAEHPAEPLQGNLLSCFRPLSEYSEERASWLIPGWIPEGQITVLAADGGVGKTTLWVNIVAAISSGSRCILDPPELSREPKKVLFMTTEDSVKKKLIKKLRLAGANMENIITPDFSGDREGLLRGVKFGSRDMELVLRGVHASVCVFDPVQGFVPPEINMGSRNAMRDCMAPLIAIGEDIAATSLVICHTNKRKGASGRDRIADSADLWDIARSVIMMGYTEENNIRYLSNEKNNYDTLQQTILFSINEDGRIEKTGTTWKRDRDYQLSRVVETSKPKLEVCKAWIFEEVALAGGRILTKELDEKAAAVGYSRQTYKVAKTELRSEGQIVFLSEGSSRKGGREWYTVIPSEALPELEQMELLPDAEPVPFN